MTFRALVAFLRHPEPMTLSEQRVALAKVLATDPQPALRVLYDKPDRKLRMHSVTRRIRSVA